MKISVFGLGYVGCVSVGCLADFGNEVIGVDVNENKVKLINEGKPTIVEKGIESLINKKFREGKISATADYKLAVKNSEISFLCVGTPINNKGDLNLDYVFKVAVEIGEALKVKSTSSYKHIIAIRSTVSPGTNEKVSSLISEYSGKLDGKDFTVISNPEFLREGSAISDFYNPPHTIIGTKDDDSFNIMSYLYREINAPLIKVEIRLAEVIKYVYNSFHALKISFANEIGNICKVLNIDSHKLMDIFCLDDKLNLSPYYLKPGFAYGGSCLPKDLKALNSISSKYQLDSKVLASIEKSNDNQKKILLDRLLATDRNKIAILGISFKKGTDDVRNSPIIDVIMALLDKGKEVFIYDENVFKSKLVGFNANYLLNKIPNFHDLVTADLSSIIKESEIIVINHKLDEFKLVFNYPGKEIIDLVRIQEKVNYEGYYGIAW